MKQNVGIFKNCFHAFCIGYEIRRKVTAVKLHSFNDFERSVHTFCFFYGDNTVFTDFVHSFRNDLTDGFVLIGRNSSNLCNFLFIFGWFCHFLNFRDDRGNGSFDTAFYIHRIRTSCNILHSFTENSLCQNGSRGGAVPCIVTGFAGNFVYHLCAHIFKRVFQFNFFRNRHTVFGNGGRAKFFVDNHVSAFWSEGNFNGVSKLVDTC